MKRCTHCNRSNPNDANYCLKCGNYLSAADIVPNTSFFKSAWLKKIPALGWIVIGVAALGLVLTFIIGSFWAIATVEGIASVLFLIAGIFLFGVYRRGTFTNSKAFRAIVIGFFALLGATVDQTGNYFYNLPIEKVECSAGTALSRRSDVTNPYPGTTMVTMDFTCYDAAGKPVKTINTFAVMGYRFVEYIILAYLLIALRWMFNYIRLNRQRIMKSRS